MKKILILSMYCNSDFFINEEKLVLNTWAKDIIDGKYQNITFYGYTGSKDNKYHFHSKEHYIEIPCNDSLWGTAEKTIKCFKFINKLGLQFDYIFRTNTSTYINVSLLNELFDTLYDNDIIWSSNIFCPTDKGGPYLFCLFPCGRSLILSKKYFNILIDNKNAYYAYTHDYASEINNKVTYGFENAIYKVDDNYIGFIINSYFLKNQLNHVKFYKTFGGVSINDLENIDNNFLSNNIIITFRINTGDNTEKEARLYEYELYKQTYNKINKNNKNLSLIYMYINDEIFSTYIWGFVKKKELIKILLENTNIPYLEK